MNSKKKFKNREITTAWHNLLSNLPGWMTCRHALASRAI